MACDVLGAGVRNSVGFDWDANGTLYFTNNGIDQLGNDQPDDQLQRAAQPGLFFGFPYCHSYAPALCKNTLLPLLPNSVASFVDILRVSPSCSTGVGDPYSRLPGISNFTLDPDFAPNNSTNNATSLAFCQGLARIDTSSSHSECHESRCLHQAF
jgi:hypothetical protein